MRVLLIGALAATLVGCNCLLPPQANIEACTVANGFACFDRTAASQPIEPEPVSIKTNSATKEVSPRSRRRPKSRRLLTPATGPISPRKRRSPP